VNCGTRLDGGIPALLDLYRIDQVSTRRADRITSDEEERQRQGYEVITTLRFAEQNGHRRFTPVAFSEAGDKLLSASYGPAATVWRINLGWRRRKNKSIFGFNIDVASGLERAWLTGVRDGGFRLPDRAQPLLSEFSTQPDFAYDDTKALIYVDGPHHQQKATKTMDENRRRALRDAGYKVVVFTEDQSGWPAIFGKYPFIFGRGAA
jgi:hypothetical protein